jgi:cobalt-zinc-cadmium efflux system membrane fusion protein
LTNLLTRVGIVVPLVLALAGCGKHGNAEESSSPPVPEVTVAKVVRGPIADNLLVSGNLAALPNRDAKVAALVPGRVARVLVVEGDNVAEGQTLAELDSSLLLDQLHQAEAAVAQAKANVDNARLAAEREEGLLARGISSRKEVEDARTQLAVNTALLKQAEAALATATYQVARSLVRAPFAGTVVKRFVGVGEQVDGTAAQPVAEVARIETLELLGSVPAGRLSEAKRNEAFTFETNAASGTRFTARVTAILPAVDPATNNGTVRIRIENSQRLLKLGEFLSINLPLKPGDRRLLVPRQSIYPDESGAPHVYKVVGDDAEFVPVQVGIQTNDRAEILSGIQEGDTVIVNGGYGLPEKSKVHVKP